MRLCVFALVLLLACQAASAREAARQPARAPVFDIHVHLREGEASLREYKADVESADLQVSGLGAMWFCGPHQAPAGNPDDIRARNDALIALAADHPEVLPIATVHPYDGQAALDELAPRIADGFGMDNVYFDISAMVLLAGDTPIEEEFVWTLRNVGIDHVILGSDYPQISLARPMEAFEKLALTEEEKTKIRVGNARKLFGL